MGNDQERHTNRYLHANPSGKEKGMQLVFNPRSETIAKTLNIPLYRTGLTGAASLILK